MGAGVGVEAQNRCAGKARPWSWATAQARCSAGLMAEHEPVSGARIVIVAFGTRGDVQPLCLLGRALLRQGHDVTVLTLEEYADVVRSFGLPCTGIEAHFEEWLQTESFDTMLHGFFTRAAYKIGSIRRLSREIQDKIFALLVACLQSIRSADLVVYNPFAFFAGIIAEELAIPSVHVMCQPLLATSRAPLCVFGGADLGRFGNRLSYEALRPLMFLFRGAFRRFRATSGTGRRLHAWTNPLSATLRTSSQVLAYSPAVSPAPDDWRVRPTFTGFWFDEPAPDATLPPTVLDFLAAGEPPIYIGFGSMPWGAERNTAVIMKAVELWGGRAIVARGGGGLRVAGETPPNVLAVGYANHALLFPRLGGCVHHGGAGTTARVLRSGMGSVVLPMLGDQLFWGRRVAALGAGEAPVLLSKVTPPDLAQRLATLASTARFRDAARRIAETLAEEPGVQAAVDLIDTILSNGPGTPHGRYAELPHHR